MNSSEGIFKILMIESDHNYFRNKIKNKKGGKNLIIDQDSHCNQQ
jgi:hypothetical protein